MAVKYIYIYILYIYYTYIIYIYMRLVYCSPLIAYCLSAGAKAMQGKAARQLGPVEILKSAGTTDSHCCGPRLHSRSGRRCRRSSLLSRRQGSCWCSGRLGRLSGRRCLVRRRPLRCRSRPGRRPLVSRRGGRSRCGRRGRGSAGSRR